MKIEPKAPLHLYTMIRVIRLGTGVVTPIFGDPKELKEEETEWIRGTGDGFLVWDINGNGKIDSNTEMMSNSMPVETKSSKMDLKNFNITLTMITMASSKEKSWKN